MARTCSLSLALAGSLAVSAASARAQNPDSSAQALAQVSAWLTSTLPRVGTFSVNVTGDWANAGAFRSTAGSNRSVEARHQIREVTFENCELRYRSDFQFRGAVSEPFSWNVVLPLAVMDLASTRVQQYVLPSGLRATNSRSEAYVRAVATSTGFTVTDRERRTISVWEHSIPVARSENADEVLEVLGRAARLCGVQ